VAGGTVYVGSGDNHLYALDAETGQQQWRFETGDDVHSSPAVSNQSIYIGSADKYVYAIDAETGQEQWRFEADCKGYNGITSISIFQAVMGGTVYVGNGTQHASDLCYLFALDANTGKEQWRFNADSHKLISLSVKENAVYIGNKNGHIHGIGTKTGEERWRFENDRAGLLTTVVGGAVYVGGRDGNVYAINPKTGQQKWRFKAGDKWLTFPTVTGGTLYVGGGDGNVYAVE